MLGPFTTLKLGHTQYFDSRQASDTCLTTSKIIGVYLVGKTKGFKQILMDCALWKDALTLRGSGINDCEVN